MTISGTAARSRPTSRQPDATASASVADVGDSRRAAGACPAAGGLRQDCGEVDQVGDALFANSTTRLSVPPLPEGTPEGASHPSHLRLVEERVLELDIAGLLAGSNLPAGSNQQNLQIDGPCVSGRDDDLSATLTDY